MRKILEDDIKANCNQDLAAVLKDLMVKHNALVVEFNALAAEIESNKAAMGSGDFSVVSANVIDID